jgi:hypothetical protein
MFMRLGPLAPAAENLAPGDALQDRKQRQYTPRTHHQDTKNTKEINKASSFSWGLGALVIQ